MHCTESENKSPFKVACFSWLVTKKAYLTEDNLQKGGTILCSRFHLCGKEAESVNHLFLNRNVTAQLWQIYLNIKGLKWVMPRTLIQLLQCWNRGKRKKKKSFWRITIPANIWGTGRKERNTKCFEGKSKFDPTDQI